MFFRSLDTLTEGAPPDANGSDGAPQDAGADGPTADAVTTDGPSSDARPGQGFCASQDPDAGPGGLYVCFDYDDEQDGGYDLNAGNGAEIAVEDAGAPGTNALVLRVPSQPSLSSFGFQRVRIGFAPKRAHVSYRVQLEWTAGQAGDALNGPTILRSDVYDYVFYDFAAGRLMMNEQDQRDASVVNGPPHSGFDVDMRQWHRIDFMLDYEAATFSVHVDGVKRMNGSLTWASVPGNAMVLLGTSFHYGNPAPVVMRYDDVVIRALP